MTESHPFQTLLVETTDGVATVTLNRPENRNLLDPVLFAELARALGLLDERDDVRVIVLTGAGSDFCAGADLAQGPAIFSKDTFDEFEKLAGSTVERPADVDPQRLLTPVIAAVNGTAAGGGLTLALQCDIVIVAEEATLALPFTRRGLVAERNAHWLLPRLLGPQRSLELLLTGRKFRGSEAVAMGMALRAVPAESVLSEAQALARSIADHAAPAASAATKRLLYRALREPDADVARSLERTVFQELGASADCAEGVAAHRERRRPRWTLAKRDVPAGLRDDGE